MPQPAGKPVATRKLLKARPDEGPRVFDGRVPVEPGEPDPEVTSVLLNAGEELFRVVLLEELQVCVLIDGDLEHALIPPPAPEAP